MYDDMLLHPLQSQQLASPSMVATHNLGMTHSASDGAVRRLARPKRGRRGNPRGAELLDADYLRQIIPTRNRSLLLSTSHRRKRALRTKRAGTATAQLSATAPPSWLEHLPARSRTVPQHTMRERWRAMTARRAEPQDHTLDAETRAQMQEEKAAMATSMGLTMAELEEMDQAAGGDSDEEEEYKRAFEVRGGWK